MTKTVLCLEEALADFDVIFDKMAENLCDVSGSLGLMRLTTKPARFQSKLTGVMMCKHMDVGIFVGPSEALDRTLAAMGKLLLLLRVSGDRQPCIACANDHKTNARLRPRQRPQPRCRSPRRRTAACSTQSASLPSCPPPAAPQTHQTALPSSWRSSPPLHSNTFFGVAMGVVSLLYHTRAASPSARRSTLSAAMIMYSSIAAAYLARLTTC